MAEGIRMNQMKQMAASPSQVVAPSSVRYDDQLPLGIEAKSHRRLFFPSTGDTYGPSGTNICRIDINYDGLLDTSQSYLLFSFTNKTGKKLSLDYGQPVISRLKLESGGVVLEDIQSYNQLLAGILVPAQAGTGNLHLESFNMADHYADGGASASSVARNGFIIRRDTDAGEQDAANGTGVIANNSTFKMCYKLVSGLLDNDKYLPLVLMNAGLTLEFTLAPGIELGVSEKDDLSSNMDYEIKGVRYVAHLIDLERSFYDRLRAVQQNSGGVLTIAGTSFRSYTGQFDTSGSQSINIPARVRSIKSVFFKLSAPANNRTYSLSNGSHGNINQYHLKIGATNYPPTAVEVNAVSNKAEPYLELQKAFGKLGSTVHSDLLGSRSYLTVENIAGLHQDVAATSATVFAPFGIDLEAFRHQIENGIDTSSRALPMTLITKGTATTANLTAHVFVMYDAMFYIDMSGAVTVSS